MTGDIITYDYYGSLYINLTNRCDCRCVFCIRDQADSSLGGLWLQEEPKKEDVLAEILGQDLTQYAEIVFCGYGEPTCRLDDLLWSCKAGWTRSPSPSTPRTQPITSPSPAPAQAKPPGRLCWTSCGTRRTTSPRSWSPSWTTKKHPRRSKPAATWLKASAPSSACAPSPGEKKKGRVTEKKGIRQRYPSFLSFLINLLEK